MSEIATTFSDDDDDLAPLSDDEILRRLQRGIETTIRSLLGLVRLWNELAGRGYDMAPLRTGLLYWVARVASGMVVPELVARLWGTPALSPVSHLSPADQEKLLRDKTVEVAIYKDGEWDHIKVHLGQLTTKQTRQVFRRGFVRSVAEQTAELKAAGDKPPRAQVSEKYGNVTADALTRTLMIGRSSRATFANVIAALREVGAI